MAELADAPDLGSGGEIRRGSSPLPGTALTAPAAPWFTQNGASPATHVIYNPKCREKDLVRIVARPSGGQRFTGSPIDSRAWVASSGKTVSLIDETFFTLF